MTEDTANWNTPADASAASNPADDARQDVAQMTFEQALAELERIVQELERGQLDLDAAIKAYERGTKLKTHCEAKLREAQLRVEKISLTDDGKASSEPMELG